MSNVIPIPTRPRPGGLMHVRQSDNGLLLVEHEGRSGDSFAILCAFASFERDAAIAYALDAMRDYQPCALGEIAP